MLVRAFWEVGTGAFPKAPGHEFDVTQAYLFPAQPFTPLGLMLGAKLPASRIAMWPLSRRLSVNVSGLQQGNRQ